MDISIDAKIPRLQKVAHLDGLRRISSFGKISYEQVHSAGDASVRQHVIARYLSEEAQSRENASLDVTPANYRFDFKGETILNGHTAFVFSVKPLHKRDGLYRGQIWIDEASGMPIREAGRLYASSVFLKRIDFTRSYRFQDQVAVPEQLSISIDTRVVGKAEMTVAYSHVTLPEPAEAAEQLMAADLQ